MMKVAVIGGFGRLGLPVAKAMAQKGWDVSIVSPNAKPNLQGDCKFLQGDVHNLASLIPALQGMDAVHINLAGKTKQQCEKIIHQGTLNIIQAAKQCDIKLISMISGTTVNEGNTHFYDIKAKYQAESALMDSGLPYLIFCPSWFMETLGDFVQENRASVFGPANAPIHWLAAEDYADKVVKAYGNTERRNQRFILHGPNPLSLSEALSLYLKVKRPLLALTHAPYWLGPILSFMVKDPSIKYAAHLCRYYEEVGDIADPTQSNALLGAPTTTLQQWLDLDHKAQQLKAS